MAKTEFGSVDEYIASCPVMARRVLAHVRRAIRRVLPEAAESISYQMPAYTLHGNAVLYLAGWEHHYSIYPATSRVRSTFKHELGSYEVSKGTIRFPLSEPVPVKLIERIARLRAKEVAEKREWKMPVRKQPRTVKRRPPG